MIHSIASVPVGISCPVCLEVLGNFRKLALHIDDKHIPRKGIWCEGAMCICGTLFRFDKHPDKKQAAWDEMEDHLRQISLDEGLDAHMVIASLS